jgi:TrpR-related protein YerC/YecD
MIMNKSVPIDENNRRLLFRIFVALDSEDEAAAFFDELCTQQEVKNITQRVAVAELLMQRFTYDEIKQTLKRGDCTVSSATVNRVNDTVRNGPGNLWKMIQRVSGIEGC